MKTYTAEELKGIIERHRLWLEGKDQGERADLRYAYLQRANLQGAYLQGANLQGANLPAPSIVLLAHWGELSDTVCLALMRLDDSAHNDQKAFDVWAKGGGCPYSGKKYQRVANFKERRELYKKGKPPTLYEAVKMVLDEKTKGWTPE